MANFANIYNSVNQDKAYILSKAANYKLEYLDGFIPGWSTQFQDAPTFLTKLGKIQTMMKYIQNDPEMYSIKSPRITSLLNVLSKTNLQNVDEVINKLQELQNTPGVNAPNALNIAVLISVLETINTSLQNAGY